MKPTIRIITAATAVAAIALVAGCSSSDEASAPASSAASAAASAMSTDGAMPSGSSMPGGDPSTWAPVQVTPDQNGQVISLYVGQAVNFVGLPDVPDINVESSNPKAIEPFSPTNDGTMTTGAGAQAVGIGASHVIIWSGFPADSAAEPVAQFIFQVFNKDNDGAPGNYAPQLAEKSTKSLTMVPGEAAVLTDVAADGVTVASSNEMAVMWLPIPGDTNPSILAVGEGTATVTATDKDGTVIQTLEVTVKPLS